MDYSNYRILIVDDEPDILEFLRKISKSLLLKTGMKQ